MLLAILMSVAFLALVQSHVISTSGRPFADSRCPPADQISPCTCFPNSISNRSTLQCSDFSDAKELELIFEKANANGWYFQDFNLDNLNMGYIPSSIFDRLTCENLQISSVVLTTVFDKPLTDHKMNIYFSDIKVLRGFEWNLFTQLKPVELGITNGDVKKFGESFKDGMSRAVEHMWFENTKTTGIVDGAFADLKDLSLLVFQKNELTSINRNMFPRPAKLNSLDFSFNKLSSLPDDIFDDMPDLALVMLSDNLLTTVSERIFGKQPVLYFIKGNPLNCDCSMKWVTDEEKLISELLDGTCTAPPQLKGKDIKDLTKDDFGFCH